MRKQKRSKGRHGKRQKPPLDKRDSFGPDYYVQKIIKQLRQITNASGYGASVVFEDWTRLVIASLEALPNHLKAIASTGRWAEDSPETTEVFARIWNRYENGHTPSVPQRIWDSFGQAFALLLESAAPGLWAFDYYSGSAGPDVLGQIFMEYTHPDPHQGQFLTPWPVILMMSELNSGGKTLVYDRLKQACQHPDNILAQAALLAGLVIEDPAQAREWFMTRVVPSALPHFEIVKVCDPCVGSGRMLLGMATQFEPWMVQTGLVQFYGQDINPLMVRLSAINCALYSLNSYGLKLAQAVHEVVETQQSNQHPAQLSLPNSPQAAFDHALQLHWQTSPAPSATTPTFEDLFKTTAKS
jgi:hypothetical protein